MALRRSSLLSRRLAGGSGAAARPWSFGGAGSSTAPYPAVIANSFSGPTVSAPTASGDVIGFQLQNASGSASGVKYPHWRQEFAKTAVPSSATLTATFNGSTVSCQMDVLNRHDDGSVKAARITIVAPSIPANTTQSGMLKVA
jgi:hypothetical protein